MIQINAIRLNTRWLALATLWLMSSALPGQRDYSDVKIEAMPVAGTVYMLTGAGGNMGLTVGEDGAFLIDDQFAPLSDKILAAVGTLTDRPVRYVLNTHWHGDHTGGNENMGNAGATLVSHDNVRARLSRDQYIATRNDTVKAAASGALPVITFSEEITFHWNGDVVHVFHVSHAHTDGDAIVHFQKANVIHTGDTFFNGSYPYIDISTGGTLGGAIAAADQVLALCNDSTKIIPGHGPLADRAALQRYRDMLQTTLSRLQGLLAQGKTRGEILAAKPLSDLDAVWGNGWMKSERFIGLMVDGLGGAQ